MIECERHFEDEPRGPTAFTLDLIGACRTASACDRSDYNPTQTNQPEDAALNLQRPWMQPCVGSIRVPFESLQTRFGEQNCAECERHLKTSEKDRHMTQDEQAQQDRRQNEGVSREQ